MRSKYIVITQGKVELPIVFSELMQHIDVARSLGCRVVGAGFCEIQDNQYVCYGESISLEIESRLLEDDVVLNRMLIDQ